MTVGSFLHKLITRSLVTSKIDKKERKIIFVNFLHFSRYFKIRDVFVRIWAYENLSEH